MDWIDLRSDTVSQPTPEMRKAMAEAEVGDDVFGEDPTVNRLQEIAAEKMGKEAGLFVASGTMGNLVATLTHCGRGDEVIMGDKGHTFLFEVGGISALGGVFPHTLPNLPDGTMDLEQIRSAVRPADIHHPTTKLIILENTHNRCGGVVLSEKYTRSVGELARSKNLKLHIDGARIFNAAIAQNIEPSRLTSMADSVTFCLSKALCAPVGSVLCGSVEFITKARRLRKMLGGGMRQAGILAAAGIIALQTMPQRLVEDHDHAQQLAFGLSSIPSLELTFGMPASNMIFINLKDHTSIKAKTVAEHLKSNAIRVGVIGEKHFRLVTHFWINEKAVEKTINSFRSVLK